MTKRKGNFKNLVKNLLSYTSASGKQKENFKAPGYMADI